MLWLGAGPPHVTLFHGGGHSAFLPLLFAPPGALDDYVVLLTSNRDGDQEVYSVRGDGSAFTQLTHDDTGTREPRYSPDGSQILYLHLDDKDDGVSLMNSDGSGGRVLAELPGADDLGRWAPDGSSIAFRNRNPGTFTYDLFWQRLNDESPRLVSTNIQAYAWSPDGSRLAYTVPRTAGSATIFDLYVFTPAQGQTLLLIADINKNFGWSPDSSRIAFSARRDNDNELFVISPDGVTLLQLTTNAVDDDYSGWVDAGARIVITRALSVLDAPRNIYLVNADGGGETRITNTSDFKQILSIGPGGRRIVFTRVTEETQSQRLYVQSTDSLEHKAISGSICTQTVTSVCGWGAITWEAREHQLAYHQFERPRLGQPGQFENQVYIATLNGDTVSTRLLLDDGTSPWWMSGSPYLLVYAPPPVGGVPIPHAVDSRDSRVFPLTGVAEDATVHDWRYSPAP